MIIAIKEKNGKLFIMLREMGKNRYKIHVISNKKYCVIVLDLRKFISQRF